MTLIIKGTSAIVGSLALGVSIWSTYLTMTPNTIGQELESQGLSLVTQESTWERLSKKYMKSGKSPEKISDLPSSGEIVNKEKLKEKCQELWNTKLEANLEDKDKKVQNIKNWCTTSAEALKTTKSS